MSDNKNKTTTKATKTAFDERFFENSLFPRYLYLVAEKNGLNWKQSAFVAWLAVPESEKEPKTLTELAEVIGVSRFTLSKWQHTKNKVSAAIHEVMLYPHINHANQVITAFWNTAQKEGGEYFRHHRQALQLLGYVDEKGNRIVKADEGETNEGFDTLESWKAKQQKYIDGADETLQLFKDLMSDDGDSDSNDENE